MTELSLVRIDFRLMHGQVITGWLKQVSADTILIVDDQLAADKFMAQVFLAAKPAGIKVGIRSIEKAVDALKNNRFKSNKMLVLFKSVANVKKAFDMGFPLEKLQVGGLGNATNKVMISKELALSKEEADILEEMQQKGVEVTLQMTPKDSRIPLDDAEICPKQCIEKRGSL